MLKLCIRFAEAEDTQVVIKHLIYKFTYDAPTLWNELPDDI